MDDEVAFRTYRPRKLPHWRSAEAVYHVTWRLQGGQPALSVQERSEVLRVIRYSDGGRYDLWAFAVMPDHVHVVVAPNERLERTVQTWKSISSRSLVRAGRTAPVWQREYFDRIVRDDAELEATLAYVRWNPEEAGEPASALSWIKDGNDV